MDICVVEAFSDDDDDDVDAITAQSEIVPAAAAITVETEVLPQGRKRKRQHTPMTAAEAKAQALREGLVLVTSSVSSTGYTHRICWHRCHKVCCNRVVYHGH